MRRTGRSHSEHLSTVAIVCLITAHDLESLGCVIFAGGLDHLTHCVADERAHEHNSCRKAFPFHFDGGDCHEHCPKVPHLERKSSEAIARILFIPVPIVTNS